MQELPKKLGRNGYGNNSKRIDLTLPEKDIDFLITWAKNHGVNFSRAVHDLIWLGYHAEKGDFRPYAERR